MTKFRYKPSMPGNYNQQGLIHFISQNYENMDDKWKAEIRALARNSAGDHYAAFLEFVTSGACMDDILCKYFIASPTTIYRAYRKYIKLFLERWEM